MRPDALFNGATRGLWDLPAGWTWARLSEVAEIIAGQSPPSATYNNTRVGLPFFQGKTEFGSLSPTPRKWCDRPSKIAERGDVLISVRAPVGPTNLATERCGIGRGLAAIRAGNVTSAEWLLHYLRFSEKQIAGKGTGTTFAAITAPVLAAQDIPLAPSAEQRRIVARIDQLFAEIAEGEAALKRSRQGLDTWRRALLKAAVTGELTRDWREANRPTETGADLLARIRTEREVSVSRPGRSSRQDAGERLETSSLRALPEGWAWATLGDLSSLITSGSRGWKQYYADSGSVFIRAQNLRTDRLELDDVAYVKLPSATEGLRTRVSRDDILVTITGANVTRSAQVELDLAEAYVNQHVGLVRLADPRLSDFVFLVIVCPSHGRKQLKAAAYGAGKPGLNLNDLASVLVPLPSLEEQRLITTRVREALSEAENALAIMESGQPQASILRQSILKAGFDGGLAPQDPADEPASALLARLRNDHPGNGARRRRAREGEDFPQPSLPDSTRQSVDPRVTPAGDE